MRILLAPNPYRDPQLRCAHKAEKILREMDVETLLCPLFMEHSGGDAPAAEQLEQADLVLAFGGDGTFLYAAKWASTFKVPVLGVNLGRTGFLAGVSGKKLSMLRQLVDGRYHVEEHMMLQATAFRGDECLGSMLALNDVILSKSDLMSAVDLSVQFDGTPMFRITGDGVIVATPTGSTAYSLSAGGPVMEHTLQSIVVTPICPHRLDARSYALYPDRKVRVVVEPHSGTDVLLSIDGRKTQMLQGRDWVEIQRADRQALLARLENDDFYKDLQTKLRQ